MQSILGFIGVGQVNATKRDVLQMMTSLSDRALRETIAYEVSRGIPIVNRQDGAGYYISDNPDEIDRIARQEISRGKNSIKHGRALFMAARKIRCKQSQIELKGACQE